MVKIDSFDYGEIIVDGKSYYSDVIIWWDGSVEHVAKKHTVTPDELVKMLSGRGRDAEIIVIGRGETGTLRIAEEVEEIAERKRIKVYIHTTPKAVELFNAFAATGKKVVALLHTTL